MTQTLDMKNAEKQVFRLATFEDGIWEIYLGSFFILMSFYNVTREILGPAWNAVLFLGCSLLLAAFALIAKKYLTQPRIGLVKFGSDTHKKIKTAYIVTVGLVLATLAVLILSANSLLSRPTWEQLPPWFRDFNVDLVFALIIVGFFSLIAYTTGVTRFYLHGILLGAGNFATTVWLAYNDTQFGWPVALAGLIITVIGVSVLTKFLRAYPLPSEETVNGR
jgi:hypothetical protein